MIAKIQRKIGHSSEDQLTWDFFGALRYLPFDLGLRRILQKSVYPEGCLDNLNLSASEWPQGIYFWPHYTHLSRKEPDLVIVLDHVAILIEVKQHSPLSGESQLSYEAELLTELFPEKEKVLLLLAKESDAHDIYAAAKSEIEDKHSNVRFGYCTWQKVWAALKRISPRDTFQKIIVQDLIDLLTHKEFKRFESFEMDDEINGEIQEGLFYAFQ
ncbi:MAG: hypothetical protein FWE69_00695 [Clostridiales bacterium]|nr:hypothetical protein [Clostridiales bacterium]